MRTLSLRRRRRASATRQRHGFSVVEIMVAMVLLGIVMMSLGGLASIVARRGRSNTIVAGRTFALQQQTNKILSLPFDSIATFPTTAKTMAAGDFRYKRLLTITKLDNDRYTIKIVILPQAAGAPSDSLILNRTRPPTSSVLCQGCP